MKIIKRIFQVIPNSGTIPSSVKSAIWKNNLYDSLVKLGFDVVLLDYEYDDFFVHAENDAWLKKRESHFSEAILNTFKRENEKKSFNLCFFYLCDGFIDLNIIKEIQKSGVPVLNYSCNNIHQFHLVKEISCAVDFAVYTEKYAKADFDKIAAKSLHMQMAANPDCYKPRNIKFDYDVSFIGQRYADRGAWIASLIEAGINVQVFGPRWDSLGPRVGNSGLRDRIDKIKTIAKREGVVSAISFVRSKFSETKSKQKEDLILNGHIGPILEDSEMLNVFNSSKINLGFSNVFMNGRNADITLSHMRLRDFEIPMCGAFYMTGYTDEINEYFEIGKEVEVYKTSQELIDKCKFYINNESARKKIAENALIRSRKSHTWEERFKDLFKKIDERI